jgi:peptidoglycan/xylan/chitin deacetylase (PgdA/CDA1 family)
MMRRMRTSIGIAVVVAAMAAGVASAEAPARADERTIAVTFDDLPGPPGALRGTDVAALRANTRKLLDGIREAGAPVTGFVNEGKLCVPGETAAETAARRDVLRMWLEAGHDLGNHTYSHRDLNTTPLDAFENEVVRGEPVTRALLAEKGKTLRYFRHPFLHVGLDLEKRRAFESFLAGRGYRIAPVTADNDEYMYAAVYAGALRGGDTDLAARVAADYLRYMEEALAFVEGVSRGLLGREIAQVLLVHANALNADSFPRLAAVLKARGYRFVTLDEALRDEAFQRPDTYTGAWGISWLNHWEITEGRKRSPSPDPPAWLTGAYEALQPR